jgi:cytochrome c553
VKSPKSRPAPLRWSAIVLVLTLMPASHSGIAGTEEPAAVAKREYEQVMTLTPNLENGRQVFLICAVCHSPEGWGTADGTYPQIAGQLRTVLVKQLADIRARNRDNSLMYPFAVPSILGGAQNVADVAAYVAQLPKTAGNGKGPGTDLELGARLFRSHCSHCHGDQGLGNEAEHLPQIAGQHYAYLVRQFDAIRSGRRKNSDPKMVKQIHGFTPREEFAVLDYTSRLPLPPDRVAPAGWTNPDFPAHVRRPVGMEPVPLPPVPLPSVTPAR